jgi:hypothetical protein
MWQKDVVRVLSKKRSGGFAEKRWKSPKRPFGHIVDLCWPLSMFHLVLWLLGLPDSQPLFVLREKKDVKRTHLIEQVIL